MNDRYCFSVQGPDHADVGLICQEMAVVMQRSNRLPEARELLQRYIDIRAVSQTTTLTESTTVLQALMLQQLSLAGCKYFAEFQAVQSECTILLLQAFNLQA